MKPEDFPDGRIEVDSRWGRQLGFTRDIFVSQGEIGSQLIKKGNCMYIQAVEVLPQKRRQGHFHKLLDTLWDFGFTIKVPNPRRSMFNDLKEMGFIEITERSLTASEAEPDYDVVMVKPPPGTNGQMR